jgi:hypothetical protein
MAARARATASFTSASPECRLVSMKNVETWTGLSRRTDLIPAPVSSLMP